MTEPGRDEFTIYTGLGFSVEWLFEDEAGTAVDFTGYSGRADIRARAGDPLLLRCDSAATPTPTLTFPTAGVVRLTGAGAATADLDPGSYHFDLALAPSGGVPEVWLMGDVQVRAPVTQWGP